MKMTVDFNFDILEEDVQGLIIKEAARQMLEGSSMQDDYSLKSSIRDTVHTKVIEMVNEKLSEDASLIIKEALNEKFSKTNRWGEQISEQKPFREFIVDTVVEHLNQMVDENGKATSYNAKQTYIEWLIRKQGKEISDEISNNIIRSIR